MLRTSLILICILALTSPLLAGPIGELGGSIGIIYPQGNFNRYSDQGFNALMRFNLHPEVFPVASLWIDGSFAFFGEEKTSLWLEGASVAIPAEETVSEYAGAFHVGLQLGSWTRRGLFRPRASLAPGIYVFNTETSIRPLGYDEDIYSLNDTQMRVGWRGTVGLDLFIKPKWGISFDFVYDQVLNLRHVNESDDVGNATAVSRSARFQAFMVGAVVDLDIAR